MRIILVFGMLLLWHSAALAQQTPIEPPVANRPADFSDIVGKYDMKVSVEPTTVQVEGPITLRIAIIGSGPAKYEPSRKHLHLFPDLWKNDFYVQEMPDQDEVHRDKKTWIFVYRLKPKHQNVDAIYDIKLVYFDPSSGDKNKFVTKYRGIDKITVTPRPDKTNIIAIEPLAVPASFYESVEPQYVLAGGPASLAFSTWQIVLFLAAPPFGCVVGVLVWRRYFPNETEATRRYRLQSAARALAQLPADGVPAWVVVHRYLQDRFRYPVKDPTPAEVASFLKRHGFAKPLCEQARTFIRECDAANFAGPVAEPKQLAADARRLIQALEADPCVRA